MKNTVNRIERFLIKYIITALMVVVIVQTIMTQEPYRLYLSWGERMEGQSIAYPVNIPANNQQKTPASNIQSPQAFMILSIDKFSSLPRARVLVNDQEAKTFTQKEIRVNLKAGDKIEVDSSAYNFPVEYQIKDVSANLSYPEKGACFTVNQGIVMLGKVIVK